MEGGVNTDKLEATAAIVKAAIEKGLVVHKNFSCNSNKEYKEENNFNAECVSDFIKAVYSSLPDSE